jgi:hypothetical protein
MRCVACGMEMQIVRKMPDQSMLVTGHELHAFECPGCGSKEQRFVFTRNIGQLHTERMQLPPAFSASRALTRYGFSAAAETASAHVQRLTTGLAKTIVEMAARAARISWNWRGRIRYLLADRR